jgi:AraC-like DNA-binding protein
MDERGRRRAHTLSAMARDGVTRRPRQHPPKARRVLEERLAAGSERPGAAPGISLAGARAAYVGPGLDLAPHANAAATVAMALEVPFTLSLSPGTAPETRSVVLIPPNTRHHLLASGPMAFVYLDPLSDDHRCLQSLDLELAQVRIARAGYTTVAGWGVEPLCRALGVPSRGVGDPRVAAAIRSLDARPQDFPRIADLAALARLSSTRFQALFGREVGMPFRRYRLWRRMALVLFSLSNGQSLTHAAHDAGFASSAHLSATFRDMFGLTPSALVGLGVRIDAGGVGRRRR